MVYHPNGLPKFMLCMSSTGHNVLMGTFWEVQAVFTYSYFLVLWHSKKSKTVHLCYSFGLKSTIYTLVKNALMKWPLTLIKLKADRPLLEAGRKCPWLLRGWPQMPLITDKHTEILDWILCVKVKAQTVQPWEHGRTDRRTDGQTDGQTLPNVLSPLLRGW